MLDLLNLLYVGVTALVNIQLYATNDVPLPPLDGVAQVEFSTAPYVLLRLRSKTEEEKCNYTGIAVPYERTWEERVTLNDIETVYPPEPGKVAGYAILINKKSCEGKPPEAMFRVFTRDNRSIAFGKDTLKKGYPIQATQLASMREDQRPKWLEQVITTVQKTEASSPVAREFMDYTRQAAESTKTAGVTPEKTK